MNQTLEKTGIAEALERYEGSATLLAGALGGSIKRQNVDHWKRIGKVPAEHCPQVERVTLIPSERLNPDVDWAFYRGRPKPPGSTASH